jgi:MFS family permease
MVIVNTVIYVRDYLGGTESGTALAFAASGAGSMAVALLLPRLLDRLPDRPFMLAGGVLSALGLSLGLLEPGLLALLPVWFLLGVGSSLIQTPVGRLLRRSCHAGDRPALFSAQFALSHACWLLTYPLAGWLGAMLGLLPTFALLALLVLAATAAAAFLWPAHDPVELEHVHAAMEHAHPHVHDEHHQHRYEEWDGAAAHSHLHRHGPLRHRHVFVIDEHHRRWPAARAVDSG